MREEESLWDIGSQSLIGSTIVHMLLVIKFHRMFYSFHYPPALIGFVTLAKTSSMSKHNIVAEM